MSRPTRRGRLDVLDRLRPGLADSVRAVRGRARRVGTAHLAGPARERAAALAHATAAVRSGPDDSDGARAGLEAALDLRERLPGPAADRLVVMAGGRVRADGVPAPTESFLADVPADEIVRLHRRLRPPGESGPAGRAQPPVESDSGRGSRC